MPLTSRKCDWSWFVCVRACDMFIQSEHWMDWIAVATQLLSNVNFTAAILRRLTLTHTSTHICTSTFVRTLDMMPCLACNNNHKHFNQIPTSNPSPKPKPNLNIILTLQVVRAAQNVLTPKLYNLVWSSQM